MSFSVTGTSLRTGSDRESKGIGRQSSRRVKDSVPFSDFTLLTRRTTLAEPTDDGQLIYRAALELLARAAPAGRLRLTGVSMQAIQPRGAQLGLFAPPPARAQRLNAALDRIADRFGDRAVITADVAATEEADAADAPADPMFE